MTSLPPPPMSLKRRGKPLDRQPARRRPGRRCAPRRGAGGGSRPSDGAALARDMVRAGPRRRRRMGGLRAVRRAQGRARGGDAGRRSRRCAPSASRPTAPRPMPRSTGPALWRRSEPGTSRRARRGDRRGPCRMEPRHAPADRPSPATAPSWPRSLDCGRRRDRPAPRHRRQPDPDRLAPHVRKARQASGGERLFLLPLRPARGRRQRRRGSGLPRQRARSRGRGGRLPARMPGPRAACIGFGLCDGATALALFGRQAGLDGLILVNPWLVEAEAGEPPPAAIRAHYRRRLLSLRGLEENPFRRSGLPQALRGPQQDFGAARRARRWPARRPRRLARRRPAAPG